MWIFYVWLHRSSSEIGIAFDGHDHSSALYAQGQTEQKLRINPEFRAKMTVIRKRIMDALQIEVPELPPLE